MSIRAPGVFRSGDTWEWFALQDYGFGMFIGHHTHYKDGFEYVEILEVYRTRAPQSSPTSGETNPSAWTRYATVIITVYWRDSLGNLIPTDHTSSQMEYRDKAPWW